MRDRTMAKKLPKKQLIDIMYKTFDETVDFGRCIQEALVQQKHIDDLINLKYELKMKKATPSGGFGYGRLRKIFRGK